MRIAIFSDTHGNVIALDAVLADIQRIGGVDAYWFVGDAVALGFNPVGTIQRLQDLPNLKAVRGNTDREVVGDPDGLEDAFLAQAARVPARTRRWFAMLHNFAWTRGALMAAW